MTKKLKKVDFRMDDELYNKLDFLVSLGDIKRGSWCRRAVEIRVNTIFDDMDLEEHYERYCKAKANRTTS